MRQTPPSVNKNLNEAYEAMCARIEPGKAAWEIDHLNGVIVTRILAAYEELTIFLRRTSDSSHNGKIKVCFPRTEIEDHNREAMAEIKDMTGAKDLFKKLDWGLVKWLIIPLFPK